MKTVSIWMEYKSYSSITREVPDTWELNHFSELTEDMLKELDSGIVEAIPEDWGFEEV